MPMSAVQVGDGAPQQSRATPPLQGLAAGTGAAWQRVAAANGIENPRQLVPGQLLDLTLPKF